MSEAVDDFVPPSMGWVDDQQAVAAACAAIEAQQGGPVAFASAAPNLMGTADDDAPVMFWEAERKVLGKVLGSWDQGQVGACVSFGYGRAAQDLLLVEISAGDAEEWPGAEIATEPIYGGSRVEVGGGRVRGDGSVGAWAARWVKDWGVIPRKVYGQYDLTSYSQQRARDYGQRGCPDDLEPEARKHPVTAVAMVTTADELWAALGAGKPVPVCSNRGFTTTLKDGFCEPSGQWAHCMTFRGRFVHASRGKCVFVQNSWGGYLRGERFVEVQGVGRVELPEGVFCTTLAVAAQMVGQRDTFTLAGLKGWEVVRPDWTP